MKIKVYPLLSTRTNEPVKNQFEIRINTKGGTKVFFQSYKSIICKIDNQKIYLDSYYWDYSRTTVKYLKSFLSDFIGNTSTDDIRNKIKTKEIKLTNLNK